MTLVLGAIFTLFGGYGAIETLASAIRPGQQSMLLVSVIFLAMGIAFLVIGYFQSHLHIQVFEQGFTYIKAGVAHVVRWDAIESIRHQAVRVRVNFIPIGTAHTYTIKTNQGETIKLTSSIGKVAKLGALIQAEAFKHLMPRAIESYNAGGTLQFGKLSVNQAGIGNGKQVVPWAQVKSVQVGNGSISIKKDGKWLNWANVAVAQTPNFHVFLALVDQIIGVKA